MATHTATTDRLDPEAVYRQIDKLLASDALRTRESLRKLLRYLAEHSLSGSEEALKEYIVGLAVFGKKESYDPQVDPSARVHLGKLRQRLEEYYRTDGQSDAVVIEVPPRRFALQFTARIAPPEPLPSPPKPVARYVALASTVVILAILSGYLLGSRNNTPALTSSDRQTLEQFWGPVLAAGNTVTVCISNPLFIRAGDTRFRDPSFDTFENVKDTPLVSSIQSALKADTVTPTYDHTGSGEAIGAFLLGGLSARLGIRADIRREIGLSWDDIKDSNVIFLGSAKFNPKLRQMPAATNFSPERGGIKNRSPQPGEPAVYSKVDHGGKRNTEDYTLISRLPGVHPGRTFIALGSGSAIGAWAATECVTNPVRLKQVLDKVSGNGKLPPYFEVIVKVQYRDMVPVEMSAITHRVIQPK